MARRSIALTLCSLFASCLLAARANAASIAYEGFDYSAGTPLNGLNGGSGWAGAWSAGNPLAFVATPGLAFNGLATTGGAATATAKPDPPGGSDITFENRTLSNNVGADGTSLYLSLLLRPETGFGFYGGVNLGGLFLGKSGTTNTYGLEASGGNIASSSVTPTTGDTVLLLLRATFLAGDDVLELFVNPTLGAEPLLADASLSGFNLGLANVFTINNAGAWTVDEIRLGTTFEDVVPTAVPEPASLTLLACGLGVAAVRRMKGSKASVSTSRYSILVTRSIERHASPRC